MRTFIFVPGHKIVPTEDGVRPGKEVRGWEPSEVGKRRCHFAARHDDAVIIVTGNLSTKNTPTLASVSRRYLESLGVEIERIRVIGVGHFSALEARVVADVLYEELGWSATAGPVDFVIASSRDHGEMIAYTLGYLFRNDPFLNMVRVRVGVADGTPAYSWLTRQVLWAVYRLDPAWERWPSAPLRWIANRRR